MGDDTLLIVLRDCGERQAMESAESLRLQIENHDWDSIASDLFVHCSVGVSEYGIEGAESFEPIQRVLYAMCEARRKGGNCVISETTLSTELLHRAKTRSMYRSIPIS
jgi:GGDEF domain-containing protein